MKRGRVDGGKLFVGESDGSDGIETWDVGERSGEKDM